MRQLGVPEDAFGGSARIALDLSQRGSEDPRFSLEANLADSSLAIAALDWVKEQGTPGTLRAEGTLGRDTHH